MDDIQFKQYMRDNQFYIPKKLSIFAEDYPNVTWFNACKIYKEIIENILADNDIELITDLPCGKGLFTARVMFLERLREENNK